MENKNAVELLAPARDCAVARSAILAGADAVYIGASHFGARAAAANTEDEIAKLCSFAHLYGCRVYVALNTILTDSELAEAARMTYRLKDAGVDALIVQDFGLLACDLAAIALHASTQCDVRTPEKAKLLEALGFETIVLARELSLEEISAISKSVSTRIECFVHGALCVSYSGCCYLSQAVGGRSGNRGECAQPCRLKYSIFDADENPIAPDAHYLCLHDMNRANPVGEMLDVGVRSFKIEGRLKDASYVKNITAYYRRALDKAMESRGLVRQSFGDCKIDFVPNPQKTFNRGFCEYHLHGTQSGCGSFSTPKSRGQYLGVVERTCTGGFLYPNASGVFANGDGLMFESASGSVGGSVNGMSGDRVYVGFMPVPIEVGAKIWRNLDTSFEKALKPEAVRKMRVKIALSETSDKWIFSMHLDDARGLCAEKSVEKSECSVAQNPELAKRKLSENLSKLGASVFAADGADFAVKELPFLPPSHVNEIRRALVEELERLVCEADAARRKSVVRRKNPQFPLPPELLKGLPQNYEANVLNRKAADFYAAMGSPVSEYAPESGKINMHGRRVMTSKHCILRELGLCLKTSQKKTKVPLILKSAEAVLKVYPDCTRCGSDIFF